MVCPGCKGHEEKEEASPGKVVTYALTERGTKVIKTVFLPPVPTTVKYAAPDPSGAKVVTAPCKAMVYPNSEAPSWDEVKLNDLDAAYKTLGHTVNFLLYAMDFVHRIGLEGGDYIRHSVEDIESLSAGQWYEKMVQHNAAGLFCFEHDYMYATILSAYGFDPAIATITGHANYDMGGHTMVVVPLPGNDGAVFQPILCPMFNFTYANRDGKVLALRDVQLLELQGRRNEIYWLEGTSSTGYLQNSTCAKYFCCYDSSKIDYIQQSSNPKYPYKIIAKRTLTHYLKAEFNDTYVAIGKTFVNLYPGITYNKPSDFSATALFLRRADGSN